MRRPLDSYSAITTNFKEPVIGSKFGLHTGTDYATALLTPVYAPVEGVVRLVQFTPDVGQQIELGGSDGHYWRFLHLTKDSPKVMPGQRITEGYLIALSGNTGKVSTGPHLHLDIRKPSEWEDSLSNYIDPEKYLKENEVEMTRGVMAAMKFGFTRQNECTDAEYTKYSKDLAGFVQYLTRVQAEHNVSPIAIDQTAQAQLDKVKEILGV